MTATAALRQTNPRESFGRITACILTYNRKDTLLICIRAVLAQSCPVDRIMVYDNASTDGTQEELARAGFLDDPRITVLRAETNTGPAGGFSALFRAGYATGCEWLWAMDDDVIPEPDALAELVVAYEKNFSRPEEIGFLVSRVQTPDGEPNNVPDIDNTQDHHSQPRWAHLLHRGMVKVAWSTLNSILLPRSTFRDFGFTSPDFFYGGEEIDLTLRIVKERPGYLVGRSLATHLRETSGSFHPLNEKNAARIPLYFYFYRNQIYLRRSFWSRKVLIRFSLGVLRDVVRVLLRGEHGKKMAWTMLKGMVAGFFFKPRYPKAVSG
jgi:GT2 family glycosyltransferase